jgi:hypothetical protein
MPMGESINTFLISVYRASNVIQKSLVDNYAILIVLALASVAAVFLLLAMTSLRRGNISVVARAIFFLALGLCAIPFVLLLWTLRWLPVYLLNIGVNIFTFISSWVGWFFQIILPPFFILVGGILAIILVVTLLRHGWGRLLLLVMAVAILGFVTLGGDIQSVLSALGALGGALKTVVSYPINAISFILSFIVAALGFVLVFSFVTAVAMLIVSQFGHILVDSLFDARNVRKSARAAGRFLVGIGFLTSTILLCLPGNKLAQRGAISASQTVSQTLGQRMTTPEATTFVDSLATGYLLLIPDSMEIEVDKAFSYGYPPSLELILLTVACGISFILIGRQIFGSEEGGEVAIAFFPRELFFLLVGAALVLVLVFAAAGSDSS